MKKIIVWIGFVVSFILIGTGLVGLGMSNNKETKPQLNNNDNTKNKLDILIKSLRDVKNISNFTYEIEIETDTPTEKTNSLLKVNLDTKESELSMSIADNVAIHSFTVLEEGQLISYTSVPMFGSSNYTKSRATEENTKINYDASYVDTFLNNISLIEVKGDNLYTVKLPKEIVNTINVVPENGDETVENNQQIIDDVEVVIKLDNNNVLEKIIYDFSNSLQIGEKVYTKYFITFTYYDVGITKVVVPDEIKSIAVES